MVRKSFERDWLIRGKQLVTIAALAAAFAASALVNAGIASAAENSTIFVSDVEQLYRAVNEATNAGATVYLYPGVYTLSVFDPIGAQRPNGGRLELQRDMSLSGYGVDGDRSAVLIDPSRLPDPSFRNSLIPGRTGVIRVGRGSNAIEWLTIASNRFAAAAIETDLVETDEVGEPVPTAIRITHVVAYGIARGVDIRNITGAMAGRHLKADIEDNEFFWGVEGIRVINFQGANDGKIIVAMGGNRSHANRLGCIIENNRSSSASISVVSSGDLFDDNGLGCQIGGGLITTAGAAANDNSVRFDAYSSAFKNNTRLDFNPNVTGPDFDDYGGLLVAAGDVQLAGLPNSASRNTVVIRLWDVIIADNVTPANEGRDFVAFGARCNPDICDSPGELAGTQNETVIQLRGLSTMLDVEAIDSEPSDPDGTNSVTVVRFR
jgi:hypothetical protein